MSNMENVIVWRPIESAPWDVTVLLTGPSGMKAREKFLISGYRVKGRHQGSWNDVLGYKLSDCCFKPTHWARMVNLP